MRKIVVTGAKGFIGRNLVQRLKEAGAFHVNVFDLDDDAAALEPMLAEADFVFHLAGVNRPQNASEFAAGNTEFTEHILKLLRKHGRRIPLVLTSSTQAAEDNPYGRSKRLAERAVFDWAAETGGQALIYRLPNVFGKWCRPNYNSVVATFCHNIARGLPIQVMEPTRELTLVYIDDVMDEFLRALDGRPTKGADGFCIVPRSFRLTLQELADKLIGFGESRRTSILPDFSDALTRFLYATYVSHLPTDDLCYRPEIRHDDRGWLAELIKSPSFGQIFVSRTRPGVARGNHWHHTKVEKFIVLAGSAVIRFRKIDADEVIEVPVSGDDLRIVDIPPGYTHTLVNVGETDLITLFWADEIFDPAAPDTYALEV